MPPIKNSKKKSVAVSVLPPSKPVLQSTIVKQPTTQPGFDTEIPNSWSDNSPLSSSFITSYLPGNSYNNNDNMSVTSIVSTKLVVSPKMPPINLGASNWPKISHKLSTMQTLLCMSLQPKFPQTTWSTFKPHYQIAFGTFKKR